MDEEKFICDFCGKECKNLRSQKIHQAYCKENPNRQISFFVQYNQECSSGIRQHPSWNRGLTKETDSRIKDAWCKGLTKDTDERLAKMGQKLSITMTGKPQEKLTQKHKEAISRSMKKAHVENRAHNIGSCRWNNKPSYPETWFIKVLENELGMKQDIDYQKEFSFHRFSLDFAWPEKKICVEIDGEQHQRFEEQKLRDIEKDKLLLSEGWKELRIPWKECFSDPKIWIEKVKNLFLCETSELVVVNLEK